MSNVSVDVLDRQEAANKISELVKEAHGKIAEAERLADQHGLDFSFDLAYGMGGTYYGEGHTYDWVDTGWNPSSMSC